MTLFGAIEVILGLSLLYVLMSALASAVNESLAQTKGWRGRFLREGLTNLLTDRWIYLRVVNHPLVASLYREAPGKPYRPSYIPAANFAQALFDVVLFRASQLPGTPALDAEAPLTLDRLRAAALRCRHHGYAAGEALLPLLDHTGGSLEAARHNVEAWYDSAMDRVSGWYKRSARRMLFAIGLALAVLFNVDTLAVVTHLVETPATRAALATLAEQVVRTGEIGGVKVGPGRTDRADPESLKKLVGVMGALESRSVPLGFSCLAAEGGIMPSIAAIASRCWKGARAIATANWVLKIVGWLLTAAAVSFGAPFWFDLLNRIVNLRGAGGKPS